MQKHTHQPLGIIVDLDALLDTRLGTLVKHKKECVVKYMDRKANTDVLYLSRDIDEFEGMDRNEFEQAYKERNVETLKKSLRTNCYDMLRELLADCLVQVSEHPEYRGVKIYLNTWPYTDLTEDEIAGFKQSVWQYCDGQAMVEQVCLSPEKLDCLWIWNNVLFIIKYDWVDWFKLREAEFMHRGIPCVKLIVPAIYLEHLPTEEERHVLRELSQETELKNLFDFIQATFKHYMDIMFLPIDHFCYLNEFNTRLNKMLNYIQSEQAKMSAGQTHSLSEQLKRERLKKQQLKK